MGSSCSKKADLSATSSNPRSTNSNTSARAQTKPAPLSSGVKASKDNNATSTKDKYVPEPNRPEISSKDDGTHKTDDPSIEAKKTVSAPESGKDVSKTGDNTKPIVNADITTEAQKSSEGNQKSTVDGETGQVADSQDIKKPKEAVDSKSLGQNVSPAPELIGHEAPTTNNAGAGTTESNSNATKNNNTGDSSTEGSKMARQSDAKIDKERDNGFDSGMEEDETPDESETSAHPLSVSEETHRGGVTLIRVGNKNTRTSRVVVEAQGPVKVTTSTVSKASAESTSATAASQQTEISTESQQKVTSRAEPQPDIGASASSERDSIVGQSEAGPDTARTGQLEEVDRFVGEVDIVVEEFQKMAGIGELAITKPAPYFEANSVVDGQFKTVKLSDYKGKYLVLFFYPLDFTFVCPTEIIAFSDRVEEFRSIGCEVAACSTDSVFSHLAWVNTPRKQGGLGPMKIPLIADKTMEISKKYGCLKEDEGIAFRGLFIIDDKGNLRQITINDLPVGRSVDETLRLVQAFQFTDKHGEVCPAGWKPGKETMKPDPKGSQSYFNKVN